MFSSTLNVSRSIVRSRNTRTTARARTVRENREMISQSKHNFVPNRNEDKHRNNRRHRSIIFASTTPSETKKKRVENRRLRMEQIKDCKKYCEDLANMRVKMPMIRRYVSGQKNDLRLLKSFQDMLGAADDDADAEDADAGNEEKENGIGFEDDDDEEESVRREKVLSLVNEYRLQKAEEEQYWLEQGEDKVRSTLTDNAFGLTEDDKIEVSQMLATGTMFAVQGAVWNAILLLLTVAGVLLFVGRGDVNVATPGATGTIGY
jgi:hypothetical protein